MDHTFSFKDEKKLIDTNRIKLNLIGTLEKCSETNNLNGTFNNCAFLSSLDCFSCFSQEKPMGIRGKFNETFKNCYNLSTELFFGFYNNDVTEMDYTFFNAYNLKPNFVGNLASCRSLNHTFHVSQYGKAPTRLTSFDCISSFDCAPHLTGNMDYTFYNCSELTSNLYFYPKDVTSMIHTFTNCAKVKKIERI